MRNDLRGLTAEVARQRASKFDSKETQLEAVLNLVHWVSGLGENHAIIPYSTTLYVETQRALKALGYGLHSNIEDDGAVMICWEEHSTEDRIFPDSSDISIKH